MLLLWAKLWYSLVCWGHQRCYLRAASLKCRRWLTSAALNLTFQHAYEVEMLVFGAQVRICLFHWMLNFPRWMNYLVSEEKRYFFNAFSYHSGCLSCFLGCIFHFPLLLSWLPPLLIVKLIFCDNTQKAPFYKSKVNILPYLAGVP